MSEEEGGGAGSCAAIFSGGEGGSPATDTFIMRHKGLPNKELHATKMMVYTTEEGPEKGLFC